MNLHLPAWDWNASMIRSQWVCEICSAMFVLFGFRLGSPDFHVFLGICRDLWKDPWHFCWSHPPKSYRFFFSSARNARRVAFRLEVFAALNAKWVIRQKPFGILAAGGWNDEVCRKWRRTCGDFVLMYVIPSGEMRVYVLSFCIVMFVWILKNNLKS